MPGNTPRAERIMVVDDDQDFLDLVRTWLSADGFEVIQAVSGKEALSRLPVVKPRLVLTDLKMDGMTGMDLLAAIHKGNPLLPVILLSGQAQIPDAVAATHMGSAAFLTKPVDREILSNSIRRALRMSGQEDPDRRDFGAGLILQSDAMSDLLEVAELVAATDVTVYISGATGTGKEEIARAIHEASPRRERPFVAVNCGAIPEQLLESELFGHEKGAFTGAHMRHEGLFKAADGGTLFLDEIGDMPLSLQVKLLRVLQEFRVRPVGSVNSYPIDVRIISATHKDLEQAVKAGEFREDLYYRLKVVPLHMPSLAERREDIPALTAHFLQKFARQNKTEPRRFAPDAMDFLVAGAWPGNIRQLNNVVDLCAALCQTATIPLSLAKRAMNDQPGEMQSLKEAKQNFERNYLITVLRITHGHVANAARIAGRNRTEFYKLLGQHDLNPADFRE